MFISSESSLQGEHQKEVQTLDYSFMNIEAVNELDLSGSNLEIIGDSHSHEHEDVNDLDLSGGYLEISGEMHLQENEDEISSPPTSSTTVEPPSFFLPPLSASDTHNHSSSVIDANNNELTRSCLLNFINRGILKSIYEGDPRCIVKYPMNNYVFTHWLFESNKSFAYLLYLFLKVCRKL